jgi:hypothetical protein
MLIPALQFLADTLIPQLTEIFSKLWNDVLVPLGEFIGSVLGVAFQILSDILSSLWTNVVVPLADAVGGALSYAWKSFYDNMKDNIIPVLKTVIDVINKLWKNFLKPLIEFLWDIVKPAFDSVFKAIGNVINELKTIFEGVIDFIVGIFTLDLGKALDGVKKIFSGVFNSIAYIIEGILNGIVDVVEAFVNSVIKGVNHVIDALNTIQIDAPEWVTALTGMTTFGFNISKISAISLDKAKLDIPKFERGGSLSSGQYFEAGEGGKAELLGAYQGKTTVMPLENSGFIDSMYEAVYNAVLSAQESGGGTVVENVVNLDGDVIYRNQQKVASSKGLNFGMGVFAR